MTVSLKVSLNVMTMIKIPVPVNNHHADMINIFGILNNISQKGSVPDLGGRRGGIILIWCTCWKECYHWTMILEFTCTRAMCSVIQNTQQP